MEGKEPGSGRRLVNTSQRSLPKLKVSILVDCCSPLNTSGAVYIAAPAWTKSASMLYKVGGTKVGQLPPPLVGG